MKPVILLREYLRTCRRLKLRPASKLFKKLEYLKFIGANLCPACGEEIEPEVFVSRREEDGSLLERYLCPACGTDYMFPQNMVH